MIRAAAMALLLVACGTAAPPSPEPGATPPPSPSPSPSPSPTPRPTPSPSPTPEVITSECADDLRPLLTTLEELDARLNVGLNRNQYGDRVGDISVAYSRLDINRLVGLGAICIQTAAVLEEAFNEYIMANNEWGDCIRRSGCTLDSIRPTLQRHWANATDKIAEARRSFPR